MIEWLEELEPPVSPNRSINSDASFLRTESALSLRHLPPIKLPPFSGNFADWESFRDCFTALIIDNKDLSEFSRMHFLASSLTGSAREVISSISITADNFSVVWEALKSRYENKKKLIDIHIISLYNLPPMSRESAAELHVLRDTADKSIAALKCLGQSSEETLSDILVYFIVQKLDPSIRRAWKLKCSTEAFSLSFDELKKFISSCATALDELSPLNAKSTRSVKVNNATASDISEPTCTICKKNIILVNAHSFWTRARVNSAKWLNNRTDVSIVLALNIQFMNAKVDSLVEHVNNDITRYFILTRTPLPA